LILLARLDLLDLFLADFKGGVFIPDKVRAETIREDKEEIRSILRHLEDKRITVVKGKNAPLVKKLMEDFSIDAGEAEALGLALERKAGVVATDDRNAIRACKALRMEFITTMAVLVRAVEKGLIERDEGLVKLQKLQSIGRYSKAIIDDAARNIKIKEGA
jgi:predicted nucleic acid-binding protein